MKETVYRTTFEILKVREVTGKRVQSPDEVAKMFQNEAFGDREAMYVLHLNSQQQIIEKELVALGALNVSRICPREIFKKAIINSSNTIATIHNHPSGSLEPSWDDKSIWKLLSKVGHFLGIPVVDHLIVSPKGFYSAANEGLMEELKKK